MLKLFKTDFSLSRSILQVDPYDREKPIDADGPDNLIQIAGELNLSQVVLVEDNLGGFIHTYKELKKHKRSIIFGWRISFVQDASDLSDQPSHKIVIFVKNAEGWKSLIKLSTKAQTTFFHKEPRLDYKTLHEYWSDNLVLAVPFYDSFIHKNLTTKDTHIPDFGVIKPYFFIESNDIPFDNLVKTGVNNYVDENGGNVINAKSIYYRNREDCYIYQARRLFERKTFKLGTLEEPNMEFFCSQEFCLESAVENEGEISKSEENFLSLFNEPLELFLPGIRLPEFSMPEEEKTRYNVPQNASNDDILRILAREGYKKRLQAGEIPSDQGEMYAKRANYELKIFAETCFTDYILLVWDVMNFVNTRNLAKGLARGSAAGSLINFLLGITEVDPIPHGLYFERFVNPDRAEKTVIDSVTYLKSAADVDIDLGASAKEETIKYLREKYPGRFCKLATYGTYATKAAVKDCMKIIGGFSEDETKKISDEVSSLFGKVASPEKAYEESEIFRNFMDANPKIYKAVRKIHEGRRNISSHASAYLITWDTLDNIYDLRYGSDNEIISSVDMTTTESMCIKLDLLGLHTVSLLDNAAKSAGVNIRKLDYNSPEIYKYLVKLDCPAWLFQISGDAAVRSLNKVGILGNLEILSCILSICRPGSFAFLDQYADYLNGRSEKPVLHPLFNDILEKTSGICLFQESLLELFMKLGFSASSADSIRRIVGKKKKDEMLLWEQKIYDTAKEHNVDQSAAKAVWDIALASADYSFNKSHAVSYAMMTAASVYLKFCHPLDFFVEALKLCKEKQDPIEEISSLVRELPHFGIKLLPPDLVKSGVDFKKENGNIRYGLSSIKSVAEKSIVKIQQFINKDRTNLFELFESAKQAKLNSTVFLALIETGCMDEIESNRQRVGLAWRVYNQLTPREIQYCLKNGEKYDYDLVLALRDFLNWVDISGKKIGKESRLVTLRKKCEPYFQIYRENSKTPNLSEYMHEKELLGTSQHNLRQLFVEYPNLQSVDKIKTSLYEKDSIHAVVEIIDIKIATAKKSDKKYCRLEIADETGVFSVIYTDEKWSNYIAKNPAPQEGQIIRIKGTKGLDIIWGEELFIQHLDIYLRVRDLKKLQKKESPSVLEIEENT